MLKSFFLNPAFLFLKNEAIGTCPFLILLLLASLLQPVLLKAWLALAGRLHSWWGDLTLPPHFLLTPHSSRGFHLHPSTQTAATSITDNFLVTAIWTLISSILSWLISSFFKKRFIEIWFTYYITYPFKKVQLVYSHFRYNCIFRVV